MKIQKIATKRGGDAMKFWPMVKNDARERIEREIRTYAVLRTYSESNVEWYDAKISTRKNEAYLVNHWQLEIKAETVEFWDVWRITQARAINKSDKDIAQAIIKARAQSFSLGNTLRITTKKGVK